VNAKSCTHSIRELPDGLFGEKLFNCPFKPDRQHDRISRHDIQRAARLDPELEFINYTLEAIFTAVLAFGDRPRFFIVVPVSGNYWLFARVVDLVRAGIRVLNRHKHSTGAFLPIKSKLLLQRGSASVLYCVISRIVDDCRESLLALLARIGAIPYVVHISIESVVVATALILDVEWLRRSVHAVSILRLEK